jgi:hypothetical protein
MLRRPCGWVRSMHLWPYVDGLDNSVHIMYETIKRLGRDIKYQTHQKQMANPLLTLEIRNLDIAHDCGSSRKGEMWPSSGEQISKCPIVDNVDGSVILSNPFDDLGAGLQVCMRTKRRVARNLTLTSECCKNGLTGPNFDVFGASRDLDCLFTKAFDGVSFEVSGGDLVLRILISPDSSSRRLARTRGTCEEVA